MKLYKREGRRFVVIQDMTGMYLQKDGTFQKERTENSIGLCVAQSMYSKKVVLFKELQGNWYECKEKCKEIHIITEDGTPVQGHMPTREEMFVAMNNNIFRNIFTKINSTYWTSDENKMDRAWFLDFDMGLYFGVCRSYCKSTSYRSVLAFVDIPV